MPQLTIRLPVVTGTDVYLRSLRSARKRTRMRAVVARTLAAERGLDLLGSLAAAAT
jgi:hypothetical protein